MKRKMPDLLSAGKYVASSCWNGNYYTNNSEWQFQVASVASSFTQIPINAKVLDIGCGDGRFTKYLASRVPYGKVLGLDPSPSMLEAAQANLMPNLSFIHGDAAYLPFENQFDRIMAFNSLHWVAEINIALEQIYKALLPGGQVLILVAPIQVRHPLHQIIDEVAKRERWRSYFGNTKSVFSFYTFAEWASLIETSMLIPENLQLIDASLDYVNKEIFANSLMGWIPFGTIAEDQRKEYVHDVVEAYVAITPCSPNGTVHYRMDELVIVASKATAQ
ncbi:MAG: methyltransferase domain-containing protein [Chlamydiales bacterium]